MLGVAGILGQEILKPGVFWYNAGLPENIPDLYFGGPSGKVDCAICLPPSSSLPVTSHSYLQIAAVGMPYILSAATPYFLTMNDLFRYLQVNLGGLLAWEFLLFHWVEVRRWQDIQKHHSVDEDPIFKGNKVRMLAMPLAV